MSGPPIETTTAPRLDADRLQRGQLSLAPLGAGEFQVLAAGLPAGQIISRRRSFGRVVWFWSLSGPHLPHAMDGAGSNAHTLGGAKAAIKSSFDAWLESATGQRGDLQWETPRPGPPEARRAGA